MASAAGDGHALLLAAGELGGDLLRLLGDADAAQELHGLLLGLGLRRVQDLDRAHGHVLEDGLVGEEVEALEHHADLGAQRGELLALLRQRLALDEDLAGVDGLEAVDGAAERGLARAGRADDHDHLALVDGEVDVLEHVELAVVLVDMRHLDDGHGLGVGRGV